MVKPANESAVLWSEKPYRENRASKRFSGSFAHSNTVRGRHERHAQFRHFDTGWGHGDWQTGEEDVDWRLYHRRRLFGFIWY
jgi:hypothetical protein